MIGNPSIRHETLCQLLRTLSTVWKTPLALFWWGKFDCPAEGESDGSLPVEGAAISLLCFIKIWALNPSPLNAFSWALLQCSALTGKEKPKEVLPEAKTIAWENRLSAFAASLHHLPSCGPRSNSRPSTDFASTLPSIYMSRHNPSLLHNPGTSFLCIFYHGNFIVFEKLGASVWLPCFTEGWRCPFTAGEGTQNPQAGWASAQLLSYPSSWKRPSHVWLACFSHSVLVGNFWRIRLHLYWITQVWMLSRFSFELQNYTSCLWRE